MRPLNAGLVSASLLAGGPIAAAREAARAVSPADATLTRDEIVRLMETLRKNWKPPMGDYPSIIYVRISLNRDGTLAAPPQVVSPGEGPNFAALADSVIKSVEIGQPYRMLKSSSYAIWKSLEIGFDRRDPMIHPSQQELKIMQPEKF